MKKQTRFFIGMLAVLAAVTVLVMTAGLVLAQGPEAAKPGAAAPEAAKAAPAPEAAKPAPPPSTAKEAAPAKPAAVAKAAVPEASKMSKLEEAIAQTPAGKGKGQIDPQAPKGFMGIPGAPSYFWLWYILWGTWVGWIFSSVGAFGGIMAGVGHITVFGLADYAAGFKKTSPVMNKLLTDSIRVCNMYLVGLSAVISSVTYYRMGRLVLPLGACLAGGGILAGYLVPMLTAGKLDVSVYVGFFGLIVFAVAFVLFYETTPKGQESRKAARAAAKAFEDTHIKKLAAAEKVPAAAMGVRLTHLGISRVKFTFYGVEFSFNPIWPILGGFVINGISAFIGVGGGFLYVPFLTSVAGLPMFIVAGTSALAVLVGMITNIFTFMFVKSVPMDLVMVGTELIGIAIGSVLGPLTSKKIPEIWLKRLFVVLAIYVGVGYLTKGFMGKSILPGM